MNDTTNEEITSGLYSVERYTISKNRVRGVIEDVNPDSGKVKVRKLTTGEKFCERMGKPESWTTDHKFVRLVEDHGYNSATATDLVGDEVVIDISNNPHVVVGRDLVTKSRLKQARAAAGGVIFTIVTLGIASWYGVSQPGMTGTNGAGMAGLLLLQLGVLLAVMAHAGVANE